MNIPAKKPAPKSKVATALAKMPAASNMAVEDSGMGKQPLLKNSKMFNRLKELKSGGM